MAAQTSFVDENYTVSKVNGDRGRGVFAHYVRGRGRVGMEGIHRVASVSIVEKVPGDV